jgi:hypothetical protein
MHESCALDPTLARKNLSAILQRLSSVGQKPVADALGTSEATISRMKGEQLETFSGLLSVLGLKTVPAEHKCYSGDYIASLRYFAKLGMAQEQEPVGLEWGDE